jgi:hypothetical protein
VCFFFRVWKIPCFASASPLPNSKKKKNSACRRKLLVQKRRKRSYFHILQNHILKKEKKDTECELVKKKKINLPFGLCSLPVLKKMYAVVRTVLKKQQKDEKQKKKKVSFCLEAHVKRSSKTSDSHLRCDKEMQNYTEHAKVFYFFFFLGKKIGKEQLLLNFPCQNCHLHVIL